MKIQDLNISAASKSALKKHRLDRQTEMVALMQLENVPLTREALVKIEREYSTYRRHSLGRSETYWKQRMMNCLNKNDRSE